MPTCKECNNAHVYERGDVCGKCREGINVGKEIEAERSQIDAFFSFLWIKPQEQTMCEHNTPADLSNLDYQKKVRKVGGMKIEGYCSICGEKNSLLFSKVLHAS